MANLTGLGNKKFRIGPHMEKHQGQYLQTPTDISGFDRGLRAWFNV